jgi:ribosomal protein S18 acetylase RimI-like enzyme
MNTINISYKKVDNNDLTISNFFDKHFMEYSIKKINMDSKYEEFIFASYDDNKLIGAIKSSILYNVLHIELLIIDSIYRKLGIGNCLYNLVINYAKERDCSLATVETFDFQAPEYWKNHGFKVDFIRAGYNGNSLYYLSKKI